MQLAHASQHHSGDVPMMTYLVYLYLQDLALGPGLLDKMLTVMKMATLSPFSAAGLTLVGCSGVPAGSLKERWCQALKWRWRTEKMPQTVMMKVKLKPTSGTQKKYKWNGTFNYTDHGSSLQGGRLEFSPPPPPPFLLFCLCECCFWA